MLGFLRKETMSSNSLTERIPFGLWRGLLSTNWFWKPWPSALFARRLIFIVFDIVVFGCSSLWDGLFSFSQNVLQIFTCITVRGSVYTTWTLTLLLPFHNLAQYYLHSAWILGTAWKPLSKFALFMFQIDFNFFGFKKSFYH